MAQPEETNTTLEPQNVGGLTDKELREEFKKLDLDNDGHICIEEFQTAFETLLSVRLSFMEVRELIQVYDEDDNGVIDFHEFKTMVRTFQKNSKTDIVLLNLFESFDSKRDSKIDHEEFAAFIKTTYETATPEIISEMFRIADVDQDGFISWEEFHKVMTGKDADKSIEELNEENNVEPPVQN